MARRGFNLVEVLVALALVTVALLGVLGSQIYATRANVHVSQRQGAATSAASVLARGEALLRQDFTQDLTTPRQPLPGKPGFEYAVSQRVEAGGRLRYVEVRVYWDQNGSQELELWTRVLKDG